MTAFKSLVTLMSLSSFLSLSLRALFASTLISVGTPSCPTNGRPLSADLLTVVPGIIECEELINSSPWMLNRRLFRSTREAWVGGSRWSNICEGGRKEKGDEEFDSCNMWDMALGGGVWKLEARERNGVACDIPRWRGGVSWEDVDAREGVFGTAGEAGKSDRSFEVCVDRGTSSN